MSVFYKMEIDEQINILKEIGLNDGEIKVYLLLLKKGSMKAGQISKETHLNRSYLYKILENLVLKKLIFFSILENARVFTITRTDRLKEIYSDKLSMFQEKEKEIKEFLNNIKKINSFPIESGFSVEVYEGIEEIKSILQDILKLKKGDKIYALGKEGVLAEFPGIKYWFDNLLRKRIKKGIKFLAVYNLHKNAKITKSPLTEVKYADLFNIGEIEISFYSDKLLIYLMEKEKPRVIILKNKMIVNAMESYFCLLWEKSKLK
jgi:sugar-specific transcriptional regulator TrmB